MLEIEQRQQQILDEFENIGNWEDRYKKIIAIGKELPEMPEALKTDENKIKGCQSQVWMTAELNDRGQMHLQADSDALIVRGLVSLLLRLYSSAKPEEVITVQPDFIHKLGFAANLSQSRANGLNAMIKQIKYYAIAFQHQ